MCILVVCIQWVSVGMCYFPRAAIAKYSRLGDLNRHLLSHDSRGWKSKVTVLAELVSGQASLLGDGHCVILAESSCGLFSVCVLSWGPFLFLYRHHPMTSLNLNDLF